MVDRRETMSALGAIAFLFVFIALVLWACVAVGSRHDMPEPSEPRPIRPSVDHYELDMETGDVTYHVVVTNGDRVRSMCDEDLAEFIGAFCDCKDGDCPITTTPYNCNASGCKGAWLKWLKEEVSE